MTRFETFNLSRSNSMPAYARGDTYPPLRTTNEPISVHVMHGNTTVLFGAGYGSTTDTLTAHLDKFGGPDIVVVEHGHPDHYDGVPSLQERYDVDVAIPKPDVPALDNIDVVPDIELTPGERYWGIRPIYVPGHTPGNMSYLHEPTGTLIAGDSVVHRDSFLAMDKDWSGEFAICVPELNYDPDQATLSVRILSEYGFETALLTHGPNVSDAGDNISALLSDLNDDQ